MDQIVDSRCQGTEPVNLRTDQQNLFSLNSRENRLEKKVQLFRDLWDNNKRSNICIIRIPGSEKECKAEQLFKGIMTENFPNLSKGINLQIQEREQTSNGKPKEVCTKAYQ